MPWTNFDGTLNFLYISTISKFPTQMLLAASLSYELLVYSDRVPRGPISFAHENVSAFDATRLGDKGADTVVVDLENTDMSAEQLMNLQRALSDPESAKIKALGFFLPRGTSTGAAGAFLRRFYNLRVEPGADGETALTGYAGAEFSREAG